VSPEPRSTAVTASPTSPPVRTRFAPSPTGSMHLGNLRIAVFNHLFSRRSGGGFILRIEDTDLEREEEGSLERILEDLRWVGLDWDEGPDVGGPFGPYRQSERGERYRSAALELEASGAAYACFCSDSGPQEGRVGGGCPGGCRELAAKEVRGRIDAGEARALRFRVPQEALSVEDEVRGLIHFDGRDIADFVVLRADGRPTYNFAVAVDDVHMEITHVIRGAGHLSNTPKQALIFDAMGAPRPVFAHLPTVLAPGGGKLSKRRGAPGVDQLRALGMHPDGVVNYVSLLGWSPGDDREVMTRAELAQAMTLDRVGTSDTMFDPEKLAWVSAQHIARMGLEDLVEAVLPHLDRGRFPVQSDQLGAAVDAVRTRLSTFGEVNEHLPLVLPDEEALARGHEELRSEPQAVTVLREVRAGLEAVDPWTEEGAGGAVREAGARAGVKGKGLFHPVRLALTGLKSGPDLGKVILAQGRDAVLERLSRAIDACS
jgi:glutamyl-tRNA synthetase